MLSLAAPLVLFEKSRLWAGTGFHLLPSFHHHPTLHNYTTQTELTPVHYTDTHPTRHVVRPNGAWIENRPLSTPSIRLVRNPKHVIVQCVCIWNKHFYLAIISLVSAFSQKNKTYKMGLGVCVFVYVCVCVCVKFFFPPTISKPVMRLIQKFGYRPILYHTGALQCQ